MNKAGRFGVPLGAPLLIVSNMCLAPQSGQILRLPDIFSEMPVGMLLGHKYIHRQATHRV